MKENKYFNVKEFSYHINLSNDISKIYDEKIKSILSKLNNVKEEVSLMRQLITLSDEEIKKSKSKDNYDTLVSDKEYFINTLSNYKTVVVNYGVLLTNLHAKRYNLKKLLSSINYYNDNLDKINSIIKQYNYDIIYNEKNIDNIDEISKFKDSILYIINSNDESISKNIDINLLKNEYNKLSDVDSYYKNNQINNNNKLNTIDDYKATDCDDYIFVTEVDSSEKLMNNVVGDLDYIAFCDEQKKKKRKIHKITKVKKASKWDNIKNSLKKNIRKVVAGLMVGVTMLGISTVTTGFDVKSNNNDTDTKVVSTMDSITVDDIVNKIEEATVALVNKENKKQNIDDDKKEISKNNIDTKKENQEKKTANSSNKEITIGTKVTASSDIYINANNAYNKIDSMTPYYPVSDEREVALIYYKNNEGDTALISNDNKDRIEELKKLKYEVVAYCLDNVTHNVGEGWYNKNDVKVLVK